MAKVVMTADEMDTALQAMAHEIKADVPADCRLALIGIRRRGEPLARSLQHHLEASGRSVDAFGVLDITLYRDDLTTIGPAAVVRGTDIDFDLTDCWVVLVDDVVYTGRSVRSALAALNDLGRPLMIKLAALIDRGWRELPIQPDYCGKVIETTANEIIKVKVSEIDDAEEVTLVDNSD